MRMRNLFLAVLCPLLLVMCAPSNGASDGVPVPLADPFILYEDGTYYLYGTHSPDGIAVMLSEDLEHWHNAGDTLLLALNKKDAYAPVRFWAPEVYHIGDKYYMYHSNDEHICVAVGDSPTGPFKTVGKRPMREEKGIDNTLYIDDDGTPYIFWVRFDHANVIWMAELEKDLVTIKEDTKHFCFRAEQDWEKAMGSINEGPFILKHKGVYYLTYSGNHTQSQMYGIGYATSRSITGPWVKYDGNPILQCPEGLVGTGHHSFFKDRKGHDRIVFHSHLSAEQYTPRVTNISKYRFVKDKNGGDDILVIDKDYTKLTIQ